MENERNWLETYADSVTIKKDRFLEMMECLDEYHEIKSDQLREDFTPKEEFDKDIFLLKALVLNAHGFEEDRMGFRLGSLIISHGFLKESSYTEFKEELDNILIAIKK